eukprot:5438910-Alexandrium_andersonii.AAC.1
MGWPGCEKSRAQRTLKNDSQAGHHHAPRRCPGAARRPDARGFHRLPRVRGRLGRWELLHKGRPRGEGDVVPRGRPELDVAMSVGTQA